MVLVEEPPGQGGPSNPKLFKVLYFYNFTALLCFGTPFLIILKRNCVKTISINILLCGSFGRTAARRLPRSGLLQKRINLHSCLFWTCIGWNFRSCGMGNLTWVVLVNIIGETWWMSLFGLNTKWHTLKYQAMESSPATCQPSCCMQLGNPHHHCREAMLCT